MNEEVNRGRWKQIEGKVKERWARLTDDDLGRIEGDLEQAAGRLQERYGVTKEQAKKEWDEFRAGLREEGERRDEERDELERERREPRDLGDRDVRAP